MQSILLIKLFLVFLLNNAVFADDSTEVVYEKPVELVPDKIVTVEYNIHDHCMPIPDHKWRHFHQLAFRLFPHEFCGGDEDQGYLICFPGQLGVESPHLLKGQISSMQHRVPNLKNNKVAKRCAELLEEIAKENKCSDEVDSQTCSELTRKVGRLHKQNVARGSWHGMLVRTDSNGSFVVQISTSNENFTIPREKIHEWLVLKLASPKHGGSSFFSSNIGPLRDVGANNDRKEFMERAGYIPLDTDKQLRDGYHAKQHMGFPLRKSVGIWSLGLDLLPLEGLDRIFLASERSECCSEMDVWFMLPTARMMEQPGKEPNPIKLPFTFNETQLAVGSKISFRGRIKPDAEWIEITLTNILETEATTEKEKLEELKYFIDFKKNEVGFEQKKAANGAQPKLSTASSPFQKGEQFLLSFVLKANEVEIQENCHKRNVKLEGKLIHADLHTMTLHLIHSWFVTLALANRDRNAQYSSGLLIRGNIPKKGKSGNEFNICLWKKKDAPHTYECVFCFRPNLNDLKYHLFAMDSKNHVYIRDSVQMNVEKEVIVGRPIEVFIRWRRSNGRFEFWVNDNIISFAKNPEYKFEGGKYFLQVTGDIEDIQTVGKMPSNQHPHITRTMPFNFSVDFVRFVKGEFWELKCKILKSFKFSYIFLSEPDVRNNLMELYVNVTGVNVTVYEVQESSCEQKKEILLMELDMNALQQHDFVLKFRYLAVEDKIEIAINGQSAMLTEEVGHMPTHLEATVIGDILIIPVEEDEVVAIQ